MAVYTSLDKADIESFLAQYDVGALKSFEGISEGISNTNYLVVTDRDKFILTLFEKRYRLEDLPYFIALMEWWETREIHCPQPIRLKDGRTLSALKEKPALMVSFLDGAGARSITPQHMLQLGTLVANMHLTGMDFPHTRANQLALPGIEAIIDSVIDRADEIEPGLRQLIGEEYNYLEENQPGELPGGPIHADLFPDNVFFSASPSPLEGEGGAGGRPQYGNLLKRTPHPNPPPQGGRGLKLSGVIDFYFACNDAWAYDLAICVNAWCFDDRRRFVPERAQALMHAYTERRTLSQEEEAALPLLLRRASLRFLATRTQDWLFRDEGALVTAKDPMEYAAKLRFFQEMKGLG